MTRVLACFGFLVLLLTPLAAEAARFALVIGNAAYDGDARLDHPVNDASDVAAALGTLGWKVTRLLDGDRRAMNNAIAGFRDTLASSPNATALLYYAGHGVQIGGLNYLIPVRGIFETPDDVINEGVSLPSIQAAIDDAGATTSIVILDACRDNPFARKNNRSLGSTRGLSVVSKAASAEGSAVLFATAPGDTASDGSGRNGVFTQVLLRYLPSELPLQLLVTKITADVKQATGGKQTPYSSLSLSSEFYFIPAALRVPATNPVAPAPVVALKPAKQASFWPGFSLTAGAVAALVGSGVAVYGYWQANVAGETYHKNEAAALPDQSVFAASRTLANQMNLVYQVGLGVAAGGAITALLGWVFAGEAQP
jgi:hypothetical protein